MLDVTIAEMMPGADRPMREAHDLELLQRCSDGDTTAFEVLFRRFHPRVYRFVCGMVNSHELAEEVVADTLYAVWNGAAGFRCQSAVSSWIMGIAYRTALKAIRRNDRHARRREGSDALDALIDDDPGHDPQHAAGLRDDARLVQQAVSRLSAQQQAVVQLTAVGHSCEEIAAIVQCPRNTVKTRMFHARKQLLRLLGSKIPGNRAE